jgi:hypothetical protein
MEENFGDNEGSFVSLAPLAVRVNNLIEQRDALAFLCAEMIATLSLERNQIQQISQMKSTLTVWKERFRKYSGNPDESTK